MKTNKFKRILIGLSALSLATLLGCTEAGQPGPAGVQGPQGPAGATTHDQLIHDTEGNSSGGGGFQTRNSKKLLERTSRELSQMLRWASPEIFSKLPKGWDQNRLADLVEKVRMEPNKTNRREDTDLTFDYGKDEKGEYIEALAPFFANYASTAIDYTRDLWPLQQDVYRQLLHEAVHHLGVGTEIGTDGNADKVAKAILESLLSDKMRCQPGKSLHAYLPDEASTYWHIFRAAGVTVTVPPGASWIADFPYQYINKQEPVIDDEGFIFNWDVQANGNGLVFSRANQANDPITSEYQWLSSDDVAIYPEMIKGRSARMELVVDGTRASGTYELQGDYLDWDPKFIALAKEVDPTMVYPYEFLASSEKIAKLQSKLAPGIRVRTKSLVTNAKGRVAVECERRFVVVEFSTDNSSH